MHQDTMARQAGSVDEIIDLESNIAARRVLIVLPLVCTCSGSAGCGQTQGGGGR